MRAVVRREQQRTLRYTARQNAGGGSGLIRTVCFFRFGRCCPGQKLIDFIVRSDLFFIFRKRRDQSGAVHG